MDSRSRNCGLLGGKMSDICAGLRCEKLCKARLAINQTELECVESSRLVEYGAGVGGKVYQMRKQLKTRKSCFPHRLLLLLNK